MDIAATVLAGLIILSVPFLLVFGFKARARRKQDIAEIKALVEKRSHALEDRSHMLDERSRRLNDLHSHLNALEEQNPQQESTAGEVEAAEYLRHTASVIQKLMRENWADIARANADIQRYHADIQRYHADIQRYYLAGHNLAALRAMQSEHVNQIYRVKPKAAKPNPEWLEDVEPEALRRKGVWRRRSQGPLAGTAFQSA